MLELAAFETGAVYAFKCNGRRFYVDISADKLYSEGTLLDDFNNLKDNIDDPKTMEQFEDWVLDSLDEFM